MPRILSQKPNTMNKLPSADLTRVHLGGDPSLSRKTAHTRDGRAAMLGVGRREITSSGYWMTSIAERLSALPKQNARSPRC